MVVYLPSSAEETTGSLQWENLFSGNPNVPFLRSVSVNYLVLTSISDLRGWE